MNPVDEIERMRIATYPGPEPGDYACLDDESDPSGGVNICRADGRIIMHMSRCIFESLKEAATKPEHIYRDVELRAPTGPSK